MRRVALRGGIALVLGLGLAAVATADPPSTIPTPATETEKAPRFPGYILVTDAVGEVVKANDNTVTLRITWLAPQTQKNNRQHLSGNHRNFHNPYSTNKRPPQMKEVHQDYNLDYLPQSLVRTRTLPTKLDENGKKVAHNQKDIDELRAPVGAPAYAANKSDVTPGTIIEVYLIRDKNIAPEKATDADLRIKYAFVLGKDPNPPKDIATPPSTKTPPSKKN